MRDKDFSLKASLSFLLSSLNRVKPFNEVKKVLESGDIVDGGGQINPVNYGT